MKRKTILQIQLLFFAAHVGFSTLFVFAWKIAGLPNAWWAAFVCSVLGMVSTCRMHRSLARKFIIEKLPDKTKTEGK